SRPGYDQRHVLEALVRCGGVADVARILADHPDPEERLNAAHALFQVYDQYPFGRTRDLHVALPALQGALHDADANVRWKATSVILELLRIYNDDDKEEF